METTNNAPEEEKPLNPPTENLPLEDNISEINTPETPIGIAPPQPPEEPQEGIIEPEKPRNPWIPSFHGEGSKFFVIQLVNAFLRIITFNFYYPWAKASKLRYLYEQTEFAGSRFTFHGTGREMFVGYLKAFGIASVILGAYYYSIFQQHPIMAFFILYFGGILVYPLAIHGTIKYRMSRTSWRGIFFGYHGELGEIFAKIFIGGLITIFTLGIYWSWLDVDVRKYVTKNLRFGDVEFAFNGKASDLFLIKLKYFAFFFIGYIIIILLVVVFGVVGLGLTTVFKNNPPDISSFGVSFFVGIALFYLIIIAIFGVIGLMRQREIFQFYVDNTWAYQNEQWHGVKLNMTFGELFKLSVTNMLLLIFTLGIALPYVEIRNLQFFIPRIVIDGSFDPDKLVQTESDYRDATGEDMADWLDIDLV